MAVQYYGHVIQTESRDNDRKSFFKFDECLLVTVSYIDYVAEINFQS